jgi:hypothetical protein
MFMEAKEAARLYGRAMALTHMTAALKPGSGVEDHLIQKTDEAWEEFAVALITAIAAYRDES